MSNQKHENTHTKHQKTGVARKPTWRVGEKWTYKAFGLGLFGTCLHGITTTQVVDRGKLSIKNKEYDSYVCCATTEVKGKNIKHGISETRRITQMSYVKCVDLSLLMDMAFSNITINKGGKKNFITNFRAILQKPPVTVFNFPLELGKEWGFSIAPIGIVGNVHSPKTPFKIVNFGKTTLKFKCVKAEKIVVPAGSYPAIMMEVKVKQPKVGKLLGDEYHDWYSPEVGYLVKSEELRGNRVIARYELISHT